MNDTSGHKVREATQAEARALARECEDHRIALRGRRLDPVKAEDFLRRAESVLRYLGQGGGMTGGEGA